MAEAVIDGLELRILDQQMRESTDELHQTKGALAKMIASKSSLK